MALKRHRLTSVYSLTVVSFSRFINQHCCTSTDLEGSPTRRSPVLKRSASFAGFDSIGSVPRPAGGVERLYVCTVRPWVPYPPPISRCRVIPLARGGVSGAEGATMNSDWRATVDRRAFVQQLCVPPLPHASTLGSPGDGHAVVCLDAHLEADPRYTERREGQGASRRRKSPLFSFVEATSILDASSALPRLRQLPRDSTRPAG